MRTVHFVVPDGIDDPARPSGGNTYDRNLSRGLSSAGWSVDEHPVSGFWSRPDAASFAELQGAVSHVRSFGPVQRAEIVLAEGETRIEIDAPRDRELRVGDAIALKPRRYRVFAG